MMTLGIDIGKQSHNAALLDSDGRTIFRNLKFSNDAVGLSVLLARIDDLNLSRAGIRVGMEATGQYWMNLFAALCERGFAGVEVVNPIIIHARKNESVRGLKTDPYDALQIARYLRDSSRRSSAIADGEVAVLRTLARERYRLTQAATAEKLGLQGRLDRVFPEFAEQIGNLFSRTGLAVLEDFPTAEAVRAVDLHALTALLKKASRGRLGRDRAEALQQAARTSFAIPDPGFALALEVRFCVERLNLIIRQINQLDERIAEILPEQQALLQSIPGVGPTWGALILAEVLPVLHPHEQKGANTLVAHAGLDAVPRESGRSSEAPPKHRRMSKRGSKYLRTAAICAAMVAKNHDSMFADVYDRQRTREKPHMVALSHTAHKLLHVIFAVMRDQKTYEPKLETA